MDKFPVNRTKVCVITSTHNPFDTRIFHKECYSLVQAGYAVELVAPSELHTEEQGVVIKGFGQLASRWARIGNLLKIAVMAIQSRARVYHIHESELLLLLPVLRIFRPKAAFVYDVHENYADAVASDEKHWIPRFLKPMIAVLFNACEKNLACFADLVVTASPDIERKFKRHKAISIRNFAPMHIIDTVVKEHAAKETSADISFVYTGSLTPTRGILEIMHALETIPPDLHVVCKMTGWFHDQAFKQRIESCAGYSRVRFLGRIRRYNEMLAAVAGARGAFMCFHADKNLDNAAERSNKLFEYMGLGIPVIVSAIPAWADIINKYSCGVTVEPGNASQIAEKVLYLATHPEEAARMGANGRNAAVRYYSWATEGALLALSYRTLIGG